MSLRRRKGGNDDAVAQPSDVPDDFENEEAQELMRDNLDLMKDVIMRMREDEEFARTIYADCYRLQALLDKTPDLRPIFEDPDLVRMNFEQVYKDAGGILPEEENKKGCLTAIVTSPCFKVVRALLIIKKIMSCIAGGGIGLVTGCVVSMCCCDGTEAADLAEEAEAEDDLLDDTNENKEALNRAAEHMEDPEVQAQMEEILNDPEGLEDAIENDPELKALRDSNPLCGELMSDPETMKILTDPDNLRALGEAPELIEADFADPGYVSPDIDAGIGLDGMDIDADADADADDGMMDGTEQDADADGDEGGDGDDEEEEEEDAIWEDAELEQQEGEGGGKGTGEGAQGGQQEASRGGTTSGGHTQQQRREVQEGEEGEGGGGMLASIGVAARDVAAGAIVGALIGDFLPGDDLGGGDVGGMDQTMDQVGDAAEVVEEGDIADTLEDGVDGTEAPGAGDHRRAGAAGAMGGAAAGGTAGAVMGSNEKSDDKNNESVAFDGGESQAFSGEDSKKNWFIGMGSAVFTAAKETLAGTLLGDDLAEMLVEKLEEEDEESDKDEDSDDDEEEEDDPSNRRSLLVSSRQ